MLPCLFPRALGEKTSQTVHRYEGVVAKKVAYDYLQFLPLGYEKSSDREWLFSFLPGQAARK